MITDGPIELAPLPNGPLNRVDVQTAVRPNAALRADAAAARISCVRAIRCSSTRWSRIYIAKILGTDYHLSFIKNGHPLVPLSTLQAATG